MIIVKFVFYAEFKTEKLNIKYGNQLWSINNKLHEAKLELPFVPIKGMYIRLSDFDANLNLNHEEKECLQQLGLLDIDYVVINSEYIEIMLRSTNGN